MNVGQYQRHDDRLIDHGKMRYFLGHAKGSIPRRILHHAIHEEKIGLGNKINETINSRDRTRMKKK